VVVFFQGILGKSLLSHWLSLPLDDLLILPVTQADASALKKLYPHMRSKSRQTTVRFEPIGQYELERLLNGRHLCVLATNRPFPALTQRVNEALFRTQTAGLFAHLLGVKLMLGPTVIAGGTACYGCYQRQLLANSQHPEADFAIDRYFNTDEVMNFGGQHPTINLIATGIIMSEVLRFLTGHHLPQTISREIMTNILLETTLHASFILPMMGCPVCGNHGISLMTPPSQSLADVVGQYQSGVSDAKC
ncbi:MAG: hypothetical protein KJ043_23560, partial [Anaerolineae bacterium]|nr:hypothetical protein [Anaerolineae bacterium]